MQNNLAWKIAKAIANSKEVEVAELDFVLADYINVDAVNKLLDDQTSTWTLTFELPEETVTVMSDGTIFVNGNQENSWSVPSSC